MNNFFVLLTGELQRMKKYNILGASFLVALIWIGILQFAGGKDVTAIFPLLVFLDATSMSMLLVGVTMFFEKQEGTIKALLISPINKMEYILAKTFANVFSSVVTLVILYIYAKLIKEVDVNIALLLFGVILIAFFNSLIGFVLTYYSKDFTDLLMGIMKYSFVFMIPVLLEQVGIIRNDIVSKLLYVVPPKSSMTILMASKGGVEQWELLFSIGYMILTSIGLFIVVSKKFDEFAIKESGV